VGLQHRHLRRQSARCSHAWPEASYAEREKIAKKHENYHRGLLHFLATDPRVPEKVRKDMQRFGLPKDEFPTPAAGRTSSTFARHVAW
jgi:hypothetical protein